MAIKKIIKAHSRRSYNHSVSRSQFDGSQKYTGAHFTRAIAKVNEMTGNRKKTQKNKPGVARITAVFHGQLTNLDDDDVSFHNRLFSRVFFFFSPKYDRHIIFIIIFYLKLRCAIHELKLC